MRFSNFQTLEKLFLIHRVFNFGVIYLMRSFFIALAVCSFINVSGQSRDYTYQEMKAEAVLALHDHNYRNAIYWAEQCLKVDSADASMYNLRACATLYSAPINDEKNNDTAIRYFGKAIRYDSTNYRYYANRGRAYQTIDKHKSALKDFRKALSLDSSNVESHGRVLMSLFVQNRNKEAYAMASKIIEKFPEHGYAWYVRGQLKRDYLHKYPEGNKDIKKGTELGWRQGYWLYDETF